MTLDEVNREAKARGLSYGEYVSLFRRDEIDRPLPPDRKPVRRRKRRYTDEQAFALWQAGLSDAEIGGALGVSRQIIQRWRDTMELPSTIMHQVELSRYHLIQTTAGAFIVYDAAECNLESEESIV